MMNKLNNRIVNQILKKKNNFEKPKEKILRQQKPEVEVEGKYNFKDNSEPESFDNDSDSNLTNTPHESNINFTDKLAKKDILIDESENNKKGVNDINKHGYSSLLTNNIDKISNYYSENNKNNELKSKKSISNLLKNKYGSKSPESDFIEENLINLKFSRNDYDFIPDEFILYKKEFSDIASDFSINKSLTKEPFGDLKLNNKESIKNKKSDFTDLLIKEEDESKFEKIDHLDKDNIEYIQTNEKRNKDIKTEENNEIYQSKEKTSPVSLNTESLPMKSSIDKEKKPDIYIEDTCNIVKTKPLLIKGESQETFMNQYNNDLVESSLNRNLINNTKGLNIDTFSYEKEANDIYFNKFDERLMKNQDIIIQTKKSLKETDNDLHLYEEDRPCDLKVKRSKEQKIPLENVKKEAKREKEKTFNKKEIIVNTNRHKKATKSINSLNINSKRENEMSPKIQTKASKSKEKSFSPKSRVIKEEDRINTFNRLIEDANRRIEANNELEKIKSQLNIRYDRNSNKKYNSNDWETIYNRRFQNFINQKNFKIETKKDEIKVKEKETEKKLIEEIESRKKTAPMYKIEQSAKRMYNEAEKQKIKKERNIQKHDQYINTVLSTCRSPQNKQYKRLNSPINTDMQQAFFTNKETLSKIKSEKNLVLSKSKSTSLFHEDVLKYDKSYTNKNNPKPNLTVNSTFFPSKKKNEPFKKKTINTLKRSNINIAVNLSPRELKNSYTNSPYMSNQDLLTRNSPAVKIKLNDFQSLKLANLNKAKKNNFIPASQIDKYIDTIMSNMK